MTPEALARLHALAMHAPRPWHRDEFAALLTSHGVFLVGEEQGGTLLGFALGRVVAGEAELLTLCVAPSVQRRGIGRTLLARFLDEAGRLGARTYFLEVAAGNRAARALYARAGFTQAGRRSGYYSQASGPAEDALVLRLSLPLRNDTPKNPY